jgi:BRCT domain type II-containing protein
MKQTSQKTSPTPAALSPEAAEPMREGCLAGLKFAVTGSFTEELGGRLQVEHLVLQHGGKMQSAVSSKTNFLVLGEVLEDGTGRVATEGES